MGCRLTRLPGQASEAASIVEGDHTIASADEIAQQIARLQGRLTTLDRERSEISKRLQVLARARADEGIAKSDSSVVLVTMASSTDAKIALFRSLFRGRADVLPRRWENQKTGRAGYAPMCRNEWVRGTCGKPQVKCGVCPIRPSSRPRTVSSAPILPVGHQAIRRISQRASTAGASSASAASSTWKEWCDGSRSEQGGDRRRGPFRRVGIGPGRDDDRGARGRGRLGQGSHRPRRPGLVHRAETADPRGSEF